MSQTTTTTTRKAPAPGSGIRFSIEEITPEQAQRLLDNLAPNQRTHKPTKVAMWARAMREGLWYPAASVIMIDRDGHLLDGQNRLRAVVEVGQSQQFMVAAGYGPDAILYVDQGAPRSFLNVLEVSGLKEMEHVEMVARLAEPLMRYLDNKTVGITGGAQAPNHLEKLAFVKQHEELLSRAATIAKRDWAVSNLGVRETVIGTVAGILMLEGADVSVLSRLLEDAGKEFPTPNGRVLQLSYRKAKNLPQRPNARYWVGVTMKVLAAELAGKELRSTVTFKHGEQLPKIGNAATEGVPNAARRTRAKRRTTRAKTRAAA